jgi:hypothetical protein
VDAGGVGSFHLAIARLGRGKAFRIRGICAAQVGDVDEGHGWGARGGRAGSDSGEATGAKNCSSMMISGPAACIVRHDYVEVVYSTGGTSAEACATIDHVAIEWLSHGKV